MAIRKIVYVSDSRLYTKSTPVESFDDDLQTLIDDMIETMYDARGVGLAAPQIGINIRLCVIDVVGDKKNQYVLINPEIIAASGEQTIDEGCLSVPGVYDIVTRANNVTMRALDRHGKSYELDAEGLLAECIQHEIDHLDGKLYLHLLSPLKRKRARAKCEKYLRLEAKKGK